MPVESTHSNKQIGVIIVDHLHASMISVIQQRIFDCLQHTRQGADACDVGRGTSRCHIRGEAS